MNQIRGRNTALILISVVVVLGFGLHQGARFLDVGSGSYSAAPFSIVGVAAGGFVCLYVATLSFLGKISQTWSLFAAGVVFSLARLVIDAFFAQSAGWTLFAQICGGMGWMLVILCWMQVFASYRPKSALPLIGGGFLLLTAMTPLVGNFNPSVRGIAFVVALLVSLVLLAIALSCREWVAKAMMPSPLPRLSLADLEWRMSRIVGMTVLFSATVGFIVQMDIQLDFDYAQTPQTSLVGLVIAAVLLAWILTARIERINFDLAFSFCASVLLVIVVVRILAPQSAEAAGSGVVILLHLFFCLLWMAVITDVYERQLPGFFLLGLAVGCAQLSIALGRAIGIACSSLIENATLEALAMVLAVLGAGALLGIVMLSLGQASGVRLWLEKEAVDVDGEECPIILNQEKRRSDIESAVAECLGSQWGLSKREVEMICEYSTGRSSRSIADVHLISEHTVKTHLKRAYAKMGIHSRQELLNLIEEIEGQLRRDGAIADPSLRKREETGLIR